MLLTKQYLKDDEAPVDPTLTLEGFAEGEMAAASFMATAADEEVLSLEQDAIDAALSTVEGFRALLTQSLENNADTQGLEQAFHLSLESMFGEDHPWAATEFTQEGIDELVSKLTQGAKNLSGRALRALKDGFAEILGGVDGLKKRTIAAQAVLKTINNDTKPKKNTIKAKGGSRLHIDGAIDGRTLASEYPKAIDALLTYHTGSLEFGKRLFNHVVEAQKAIGKLDKKTQKAEVEKLTAEMKKDSDKIVRDYADSVKGVSRTKLPGGQVITMTEFGGFTYKTSDKEKDRVTIPLIENANDTGGYKEKDEIDVPSLREIETLLGVVGKLCDGMKGVSEGAQELTIQAHQFKAAAKNATDVKESLINFTDAETRGPIEILFTNYFSSNLVKWTNVIREGSFFTLKYEFQTTRALIEYCERSLKAYAKFK